jgi:DNA-directed RNA polymerase specialized sigma24 family protein
MTKKLSAVERTVIFSYYAQGFSFRETAVKFGRSMQGIHSLMRTHAPHLIRRPYIGRNMAPAERIKRCVVAA